MGEGASVDQNTCPLYSLPGISGYSEVTPRGCAMSFWCHLKRISAFLSVLGPDTYCKELANDITVDGSSPFTTSYFSRFSG